MPLNLDHFLNIAANRTTSEIYVGGSNQEPTARTRGSFRSWLVSIFKGDQTRNQRTETANAFIQAIQAKVDAKATALAGGRAEVRDQFDEHASDIVGGLRKLLANQLDGRSALTANDVHRANEFIDSMLQWADEEKSNLIASMTRAEAIAHLETTAMQFYGRETFEDIHLNDAAAKAKKDALQEIQEQSMAARGIRVVDRTPPAPAPESRAQLLRGYLSDNPPQLTPEKAEAILKGLRSDIRDVGDSCGVAIPYFTSLSKGEPTEVNRWTAEIEPGSEEAKAYLNAFKTLKEQYLGPMQTLEYFLRADVALMRRERFLDSKSLELNNGETITHTRSVREILNDFQKGEAQLSEADVAFEKPEQLSEADVAFIGQALNSRTFLEVNQIRPGYALYSTGGNPGTLMTGVLENAALVPNQIWQVIADQASPDPSRVVISPTESNPWSFAIQQQLIERGEAVREFSKEQKGLAELMDYAHKSNGNVEVAWQMKEAAVQPKTKHSWKPEARVINEATMKAANEQNEQDKQFSPELFVRGVNRSLNIDQDATPARPKTNTGRDYTHGYDDDIDAGRYEASHPSNPVNRPRVEQVNPGEGPKKSSLKTPEAQKKPQADSASGAEGSGGSVAASTQDKRLVLPDAKDLSIIDIDLDIDKTPKAVFLQWLSAKVKTAPLEQLWKVLPTLAKNGHHARASVIQVAIKKEATAKALQTERETLGLEDFQFDALVNRIVQRIDAVPLKETSDPDALISYERVLARIRDNVALVSSGARIEDLK